MSYLYQLHASCVPTAHHLHLNPGATNAAAPTWQLPRAPFHAWRWREAAVAASRRVTRHPGPGFEPAEQSSARVLWGACRRLVGSGE